ncbi:TetR/AcrR family transcriptional regulator [Chryseobacterium shandongense]|uniref:TetR/AcrR family transcriptional regulator n=1 Tax=Chryseobacterium shandongense TaxID=1493872 RepID=A0ABN5S6Y7_9FLAO|nr:TetR/AcrR family transcriptional regulator [Chryseobacterium shandongense]AZA97624.1 TetR/AcrR family transcriptional regulator [Chryseobacterium shandongense]
MAKSKDPKKIDTSTEEKIIEAARKVFLEKGYAATRTRDIAEEAGINLALLNYYFRSKEKLFQLVMVEKLQQLFSVVLPIVNNDELTLEQKLETLAENYIGLLIDNSDLPIFILSEIRANPERFKDRLQVQHILKNSSLVRQIQEKRPDVEPVHFIVSLLGMTIFPFIAKPILFSDTTRFNTLMEERKKLVAKWAKAILET